MRQPEPVEASGVAGQDGDRSPTCLLYTSVITSSDDPEFLPPGSDHLLAMLEAGQELTALMTELAAFRLEHPTDDLTTALVTTNIDGEALTQSELCLLYTSGP